MKTITRTNLPCFTRWMLTPLLLLIPGIGLAANITAQIEGSSQGQFQCGNTAAGQVGTAEVTGLDLGVKSSSDPTTGQLTGAPVVGPVTIIKPFDSCTPLLLRAGTTSERLTLTIRLYGPNPQGQQQVVMTLVLNQAVISAIGATATADPGAVPVTSEKVSFQYQGISVKDEVSGNEVVISPGGGRV